MVSFEQLIFEHDGLSDAADAIEDALAGGPGAFADIVSARTILCTRLEGHLAGEDAHIYPRLMACGDGKTERIAQQFAIDYLSLAADWAAYLDRWSVVTAGANWEGFCSETRAILSRLRERIADENALLYPAALSASIITLRERLAA